MAAQRGVVGRIRHGWRIGLTEGDTVIRIGTAAIVAQIGLLVYLAWYA